MPAITAKCGKSALRRRIRGRSGLRRFLRGFRGVDGISFAVTKRLLTGRTIHKPVGKPRTEIQLIVHIFHFCFALLAYLSIRQTAVPICSFKNAHIDTSFFFLYGYYSIFHKALQVFLKNCRKPKPEIFYSSFHCTFFFFKQLNNNAVTTQPKIVTIAAMETSVK